MAIITNLTMEIWGGERERPLVTGGVRGGVQVNTAIVEITLEISLNLKLELPCDPAVLLLCLHLELLTKEPFVSLCLCSWLLYSL